MSPLRTLWLEDNPEQAVAATITQLRQQGTVLFPTDTVYGLLANSASKQGYERIYQIKQRESGKPLQLLTAPESQLAVEVSQALQAFDMVLQKFSSGGATVILAQKLLGSLPREVSRIQPGTVGIRCTRAEDLIRVLRDLNEPQLVWATSANLAGEPPLASSTAALRWLEQIESKPGLAILSREETSVRASDVYRLTDTHGCEQLR